MKFIVDLFYEIFFQDPLQCGGIVELTIKNIILKEGVHLVITPTCPPSLSRGHPNLNPIDFLQVLIPKVFPIIIYAITREEFSEYVSRILFFSVLEYMPYTVKSF